MNKREHLILRVSKPEKEKLINEAVKDGLSISAYIRKKLHLDDEINIF